MNKIRLIIVLSTLLVACSTKTISTTPATSLKLVGDTVIVNVTGQNIEANTLDQFTREIKAQLLIAGCDIDKETNR